MKRVVILFFILINFYTSSFCQIRNPDSLSKPIQNYWITGQYAFHNSFFGKTINPRGCVLNLGFNLAKFFSNSKVLGITADVKLLPGLWKPNLSQEFINDFNTSIININNALDSSNIETISKNYNYGGIIGNNRFYIGGMFSLFPQKYGGVLIDIKYGNTLFQAHNNVYGNQYINNGGNDKYSFLISKNWIFGITLKPLSFFKNTYFERDNLESLVFFKTLTIGFFYERFNYQSAEFNGTLLRNFMTQNFNNKYRIDHRFGFKIGFSFY